MVQPFWLTIERSCGDAFRYIRLNRLFLFLFLFLFFFFFWLLLPLIFLLLFEYSAFIGGEFLDGMFVGGIGEGRAVFEPDVVAVATAS